jgi:hypothetical protein
VKGIPLVIGEYKSYLTSGKDWREAVLQLHRYGSSSLPTRVSFGLNTIPKDCRLWRMSRFTWILFMPACAALTRLVNCGNGKGFANEVPALP